MGQASLIQTNFAGGEISRGARARHDVGLYPSALEICKNAIVRTLGPADKRGGFVRLGDARAATGGAWWMVFRKSSRDVVRIEICNGYLRFWDGMTRALITSGGSPVEIVAPWAEADMRGLRYWQSGDVIWISHVDGDYPLKVLTRASAASWSLDDYEFDEGPFLPREKDNTITFSASTGTGVTATASANVFTPGHVGALIRVEAITFENMSTWAFDNGYLLNEFTRHGSNIYECTQRGADNKSGDAPPIHTQGAAWDGSYSKIKWEFRGFTHGLAIITGYTNAAEVTVSVLQRLPFYGGTAKSSTIWQLGAFCGAHGYPRAGTIHEERLSLFGTEAFPDSAYLSRSAGYDPAIANFRPSALTEVLDDDAITRSLADGEFNPPCWALSLDALIVGTEGGVKRIAPPSPDEPLTPAGSTARTLVHIPASELVRPVTTPTSFLFVPFYETELIEVQRRDGIEPRNLAQLASHMLAAGVGNISFARKPSNVVMINDLDGRLVSMTYSPENEVFAWSQHELGGALGLDWAEVDDQCAAPGPYRSEEIWTLTRRTVNGSTVRWVEYQERVYDHRRMRQEDACCLDGAAYYDFWNADPTKRLTFTPDSAGAATGRLYADGHTPFNSGHVGSEIWLRKIGDTPRPSDERWPVKLLVTGYVDSEEVIVETVGDYGGLLASEAISQWAFPLATLGGLSWLEGQRVKVNGDGGAYGDDDAAPLVVSGGAISLPETVARAWVGLPYEMHLRSLPVNDGEASGSARGAVKRIDRAFVMIDGAAAGTVGRVGSTEAPIELAGRDVNDFLGSAPPPIDDDVWAELPGGWDRAGQIEFRNDTALPSGIAGWVFRVTSNA